MRPPSTRRTTNVVERPSPVLPSKSPSWVSHQQAHVLPLDIATVSPSPAKSDASRKSHRSLIPRGSLDLATAIEISQRTNATPSRPRSFRSSSATLGSPNALTTHSLTYPSIHSSYPAVTSPSVRLPRAPKSKHRDANLREEAADGAIKGKDDDDDDEIEIIEVPEQSRKAEAVNAGWTVIEDICQSSEKGASEEAEDDFDELTEDNELRQMRVDEETDQVAPVSLSTEDTDEDDDTLTRNFINGYMQLFETDRDSLVSLYAPDAILRYRLLDITQLPSTSSPKGLSSFPFMTARGHKEISSSLLTLDHIHFYQKVDEDGKNKIDLEYHREQTHDDISLYVRSTMTVDEDNEAPEHQSDGAERQQKRLVDHDFWLCRDGSTRSSSAVTEGHGPFLIRSHLIIMHEAPL
ncbi:hypothetical protein M378DRAFT_466669 [Amanita muscaria Koide BX008]|uniref:NTF2 domain-containing protein n=1 Tax=Amanita muscaria (strain Koide BX008) TaxID=946122 RepID=A0A0C2SRC9_AMAMK|nr:hypothetical protein M378DRAFT_466669 [Amanita muscaria Koide BX008]